MPRITFVEHDGTQHEVEAPIGYSVMEAAVKNGVPGIVADCGGACACATCHVHVDHDWFRRIGGPEGMEEAMLECAADVQDTSRLSCQISVTAEIDGLLVTIPAEQILA